MTDTLTRAHQPDTADADDDALFAVYGTLRTGQGNALLWQDRAESVGMGVVNDFALAVPSWQFGFPYAVPQRGHQITVELLRPLPGHRRALTDRLDQLEGVPTHYTREQIAAQPVDHPGGWVFAWLYVASQRVQADRLSTCLIVPGGDWVAFHRDRRDWLADERAGLRW